MNRSVIGDKLKEYGMELYHFNYGKRKNTYHVYRKPSRWNECTLKSGFITVRGIEDIYLCANEVLIVGRFGEMKVNIPYTFLKDFIITGWEEE